ncbi:MAG: hypothetical protein O7E54_03595 [Planctomycetota bacterium]|nr:hypothetical protein [Planctomycetota bacterium]
MRVTLDALDRRIAGWMERRGRFFLRISLAIVFIWFGALKLFDISPAGGLVRDTVYWFDADVFVPVLGVWEIAIGAGLLFRPLLRVALLLLFLQMPGTMLPLIVKPDACWNPFPYGLTLEGQYIIKNLILISAAITVGGTVRRRTD